MSTRIALTLVLLVIGFALAGCGLQPVYGTHANGGANSPVASSLDSVYIDTIPDRTGQKLRNYLMDRFYQTGRKALPDSQYRLRVSTVNESIYGLGIAKDATATRSQIKLSTSFVLARTGDPEGKPLIQRTLTAISSFNTLASQYTTLVTEEDARDQAVRDLGDQMATMLEMYFTNPAAFPEPRLKDAAEAKEDAETDRIREERRNELNDYTYQ